MTSMKRDPQAPAVDAPAGLLAEQIAALAELFPQAFTEGKLDFATLRTLLGDVVDTRPERYAFSWAGKRQAIEHAQTPSQSTLLPVRAESVNFDSTGNLFIEGDNLEVLKLLHRAYFNSVKLIYIDPPYNTGNDFVYPDDFTDALDNYLQVTGQKDAQGNLRTSNPETSGRYHSAWLSMMYPRLVLARSLLTQDGLIFVSIDDTEVANLRLLMNELFGEENFVTELVWKKAYGGGPKTKYVVGLHEYVICYAKSLFDLDAITVPTNPESVARYYRYKDEKHEKLGPYRLHPVEATKSMGARPNLVFPIPAPNGSEIWPKRQWWWSQDRVQQALQDNMLVFTQSADGWTVNYKQYLYDENGEMRTAKPFSLLEGPYTQQGTAEIHALLGDSKIFPFPKPTGVVRTLLEYVASDKDALILDFFAGSGTTAQATLEMNHEDGGNRRFILVQLPEPTPDDSDAHRAGYHTIADIGKERIRRVIVRMQQAEQGTLKLSTRQTPEDLGFRVFKLGASNLRRWTPPAEDTDEAYLRQLELMANTVASGNTPEDIVWEAALREGYSLSSQLAKVPAVTANEVYQVTDPSKGQSFYLCLDDRLNLAGLRPLALTRDTLFICRAQSLDDTTGANLALMCRLKTI